MLSCVIFSYFFVSTWWWPTQLGSKHVVVFRDFPKYSCFTTVLTHSFSTSFGPHNRDDATQVSPVVRPLLKGQCSIDGIIMKCYFEQFMCLRSWFLKVKQNLDANSVPLGLPYHWTATVAEYSTNGISGTKMLHSVIVTLYALIYYVAMHCCVICS
jgi:hypothetical protein